jgi:uncharacterized membrane protein YhaH (DUF805 family)
MSVLRQLFWDWRAGRLGRLAFIAYSLTIWAILYGTHLLLPSPLKGSGPPLGANVSVAAPLLAAILGIVALVVSLNLAAKRFRDIGLPGWITVLGLTVVNGTLIYFTPALAYPWFSLAVFAALAATPPGLFARA